MGLEENLVWEDWGSLSTILGIGSHITKTNLLDNIGDGRELFTDKLNNTLSWHDEVLKRDGEPVPIWIIGP